MKKLGEIPFLKKLFGGLDLTWGKVILFAVIAWKLYFGEVYTTIAGAVGFVLGSVLKLLIRDRFPIRAALRQGLSYIPVGVLFTLVVAVLTGWLKW